MNTDDKIVSLKKNLAVYHKVIVAYSGGVDSTFLVKICADVLGKGNVIAVTGISQTYTEDEKKIAQRNAAALGVEHVLLVTDELANDEFAGNPVNRCYYCKKELYGKILETALNKGIDAILDGTNIDDLGDYRPGRDAAREIGVTSPLVLAGITKNEIRELSRAYGLSTWDKPANPCLASRVPHGTRITDDILRRIEAGERALTDLGFKSVRLRHHGPIARIEVDVSDFSKLLVVGVREQIVESLKLIGYRWISLDLEGYRTGSLNDTMSESSAK